MFRWACLYKCKVWDILWMTSVFGIQFLIHSESFLDHVRFDLYQSLINAFALHSHRTLRDRNARIGYYGPSNFIYSFEFRWEEVAVFKMERAIQASWWDTKMQRMMEIIEMSVIHCLTNSNYLVKEVVGKCCWSQSSSREKALSKHIAPHFLVSSIFPD